MCRFLSTPSARRATWPCGRGVAARPISIHALREEGDFKGRVSAPRDFLFLSTPSARRATCSTGGRNTPSKHFYPRPPRGGRQFYDEEECLEHEFLSTPSARRATRSLALAFRSPRNFYPRPPRGGRPRLRVLDPFVLEISIHALREEGDDDPADDRIPIVVISIHALREEGDAGREGRRGRPGNFYPRPPRGGRHDTIGGQNVYTIISIHALREEGDATGIPSSKVLRDFYPRPPRGGRPRQRQQQTEHGKFLSTPSARRATILSSAPRAVDWISIHALREEGDLMWQDT